MGMEGLIISVQYKKEKSLRIMEESKKSMSDRNRIGLATFHECIQCEMYVLHNVNHDQAAANSGQQTQLPLFTVLNH